MKEKGVKISKMKTQPSKPGLKQKMANKKALKKYAKPSKSGHDMGGPVLTHKHPGQSGGRWVTLPNGRRVFIKD